MLESNQQLQTRNILNTNGFNCVRKIGKGGFGHVLLATKATSSSTFFAIKCLSKKKMIKDPMLKKSLLQEINTMAALQHPNIVKLYKTFEEGDWYFLVLEYCEMGNLYNVQSKLANKVFAYEQGVNIFNQILKGVEVIHKQKIIHRDLKLQNIFLKKNDKTANYVKIGDFGLAKFIQLAANSNCGTQNYMAPEILQSVPYHQEVDIWSLGVLFYYLLFGDFPFKGINILDEIHNKCKEGFKLGEAVKQKGYFKSKKEQNAVSNLFQKIFQIQPSKRINIKALREHPALNYKFSEAEEGSTEEDSTNEPAIEWQINQVRFVRKILAEVECYKFLSPFLLYCFKFYIHKVVLYLLNQDLIKKFRSDKECSPKMLKTIEELQSQTIVNLDKHIYLIKATTEAKETIPKFQEGLTSKYQDFAKFKMGYRNTIGRVYEEVHRKFAQNTYERASLRLKVFFCHIINRVFCGNVNSNIFPYFVAWLKKQKYNVGSKSYDFKLLEEWIQKQSIQNLNSSQEVINKAFYK